MRSVVAAHTTLARVVNDVVANEAIKIALAAVGNY